MSAKEILIAGRRLIEKEDNWTQEVYALDADGYEVHPESPEACKWCSIGALVKGSLDSEKIPFSSSYYAAKGRLKDVVARHGYVHIPSFNDVATHAEVLAAWDEAIAGCKE